jgi:hypothetical protein
MVASMPRSSSAFGLNFEIGDFTGEAETTKGW